MTETLTETLLGYVPLYGAAFLFTITFLSCLALPVPSSLAMLAGGGFAAVGDLDLATVTAAALAGAILGDQAGYQLGRFGGPLLDRLVARPRSGPMIAKARGMLAERGWGAVFFTTWLFSPLGPWMNLAAGAAPMRWARFSSASVLGESVWVVGYVGLGWTFAAQIDRIGALLGSASGALAAALAAGVTLRALWWLAHRKRH
jgi:membrane protein DedA with SNARE-associated domain